MALIEEPRFERHEHDIHARKHMTIIKKCVLCDGVSVVSVSADKYDRWKAGTHVQDVWPEMSIDVRETLISGSHGACFDEAFKDDDDG